jgi:hypothetical protein
MTEAISSSRIFKCLSSGERHNSWWIGCSLSSLSHNQTEPLGDLWRNEN